MAQRNCHRVHHVAAVLLLLGAACFASPAAAETTTTIVAQHSAKCLDVRGGPQSKSDGARIEQWHCTGAANQSWYLRSQGGIENQYELVASNGGKCVEVIAGATANQAGIQQATCNASPRQLWTLRPATAGVYEIINVPSNRCLDVTGGPKATADGVYTELYDCTGAFNQAWALTVPQAETRDPLAWPFAADSIWNMPIGSGAVYVAANISSTPGAGKIADADWAPMPQIDRERIILYPTAKDTSIEYNNAGWSGSDRCPVVGGTKNGLPFKAPIPDDYVVPNTNGNECAAILARDGHTVIQTQPFARCTKGGPATSLLKFPDVDLFGDGRLGSHGGSKLSALGGSIRVGELRPGSLGPRHALKIDVYASEVLFHCTTKADCFRWPAATADSSALGRYGAANDNQNRAMKMGTLLAIPASVNLGDLGLETEPGRQLAWTLQNYGAYVVDTLGGPALSINAEDALPPYKSKLVEFKADYGFDMEGRVRDADADTDPKADEAHRRKAPWVRDMQRLVEALYAVDNNSPTSIGGGGPPLQPLAPPFQ